jgi:hypothetical protein
MMSMSAILEMGFLVFVAFLLGEWRYWNRVAALTVPNLKLRKALRYIYVVLTVSFIILATLLASYRSCITTNLSLSTALMLSLVLTSQAVAVGALLTPVVIKRFPSGGGFYRRLLTIECCIVTPVLCALGVNLWLFLKTGEFIAQTLGSN